MEFLLFDERAIYSYVTSNSLQNVHGELGKQFVRFLRGTYTSLPSEGEMFESTIVYKTANGLLFSGKYSTQEKHRVYCIDLINCHLLAETDENLLTTLQKSLRTALKIWHKTPFSVSERVSQTKSILFPFKNPDKRRLVIEREPNLPFNVKEQVDFPLLAYKYSEEDAPSGQETPSVAIMVKAIQAYVDSLKQIQYRLNSEPVQRPHSLESRPFRQIQQTESVGRIDFPFRKFEEQSKLLTESQKKIVFNNNIDTPLRVEGAAGTGKTCSLIMRAYWLLEEHKKRSDPFQAVFFAHSVSTNQRNEEMFRHYPDADRFLSGELPQSIRFITLMEYCMERAQFDTQQLPDRDAGENKVYQRLLIDTALNMVYEKKSIQVYLPNISWEMQEAFDSSLTQRNALISMLQHEFSVQIKGRTNGTIESYKQLAPIPNGLPCRTQIDKDFVFTIFQEYQDTLANYGEYDLDDVTMEAMSRLNAPKWRRERSKLGYDYIFIDEMHLFNVNEKSIFHYLTKDITRVKQPFCFALDYGQIIGDQGGAEQSLNDVSFPSEGTVYDVIFRNSPSILAFCASIASSGIIMFQNYFIDPYQHAKSVLDDEATNNAKPCLYMYPNEDRMLQSLKKHIQRIKRELQCKESEIVVISFDERYSSADGPSCLHSATGKQIDFVRLSAWDGAKNKCPIASPYDVNGMEFKAVILLGADEGRVPQTTGTSDISKHYVIYTAYNLLYLTASRAVYRLVILGNQQNKESSCLTRSIAEHYLDKKVDNE